MFQTLFRYPGVLVRHAGGPLADERRRYLEHRAAQGAPRSTLLREASELLVVASHLTWHRGQPVRLWRIREAGRRWAQRQRRRGRARTLHWSEARFVQVARDWLRFLRQLEEKPARAPAYAPKLQQWCSVPRCFRELLPVDFEGNREGGNGMLSDSFLMLKRGGFCAWGWGPFCGLNPWSVIAVRP